jgi:IclR family transcriptional regulator, KDG regulon repressor
VAQSVRAVERALDVLLCFTRDESNLTLTQISERVGIHKSTVHRLLATLESKRFVQRDEAAGTYHLGSRLMEMAFLVLQNNDLQRLAMPYMEHLAAEHRETVDLAILDGADVVYLQVVESPQRVKLAAAPGQRLPAFCTATGKAFLAYLPEEQVQEILKPGLVKYTEHTMVSLPDLYEDLRHTRERGFAISEQEYEDGINAAGAPILDVNKHPIAVIAIAGPSFRLPHERMLALGSAVRATADTIAGEIGLATTMAPRTATHGIAAHTKQRS